MSRRRAGGKVEGEEGGKQHFRRWEPIEAQQNSHLPCPSYLPLVQTLPRVIVCPGSLCLLSSALLLSRAHVLLWLEAFLGGRVTRAHALGLNPPGFKPQLCNFLAVWARHLPSLSLRFPIYSRGINIPPPEFVLMINGEDAARSPGSEHGAVTASCSSY